MPPNDVTVTLSNVGFGRAEKEFQLGIEQAKTYFEEHNQRLGALKARITLTFDMVATRDEPVEGSGNKQGDIVGYDFTVQGAKVTLPPRLGLSQHGRLNGVDIVFDQDEIDKHKTRALPFLRQIKE